MSDIVAAVGLVLALEGAIYAIAPSAMRNMMMRVAATPSDQLRFAGVTALAIGVGVVWIARA
ncbi:MAG: DUF2065 domain-containing protein [Pseudomonadota bacterium]